MSAASRTTAHLPQADEPRADRSGDRGRPSGRDAASTAHLAAGAIAGLSVGLLALVASMGWAVHQGRPPVAPLAAAATIFNVASKPTPTPDNLAIGLVTHLTLTVVFGLVFAALIAALRSVGLAPSRKASVSWAIAYGLLLYVVNFQLLGRTTFPVFSHLAAGEQAFNIVKHALFGLLLLPFVPARGPLAGRT